MPHLYVLRSHFGKTADNAAKFKKLHICEKTSAVSKLGVDKTPLALPVMAVTRPGNPLLFFSCSYWTASTSTHTLFSNARARFLHEDVGPDVAERHKETEDFRRKEISLLALRETETEELPFSLGQLRARRYLVTHK